LVQLVTRISGGRTPRSSRGKSSRSDTPRATIDDCSTRGLLAFNVLGILEKFEFVGLAAGGAAVKSAAWSRNPAPPSRRLSPSAKASVFPARTHSFIYTSLASAI